MALIEDPKKKLQEEEEKKVEQTTENVAPVDNNDDKVEETTTFKKEPIAPIEPTNKILTTNAPHEKEKIQGVEVVEPKWNREPIVPKRNNVQKEINRHIEDRKEANKVVNEDRSANALRDYGRYFRNNSYGNTFDQEQLQTSMQPEDIRAFQKKHGIPVTGWVGRRTYLKLKEEWEKANNTEEAKEKEADEAEKALASDPTLSPAEQDMLRKDFAKNAEVRAWAKKYSSETPKDFTDESVKELQAILNKYGYNTKNDDIFGEQTMWHFVQALETKDPELASTLKQAGVTLGEDGSVSVQRPYDHIMDYLNDKQDRERAMYERDYALRKSERDRKMQALNDVFSMIKDTVVASGGVKPESRDTSDKYKAIQKYAQDANEKYRKYEEDRRNKIIEMAKANEDERQRRLEEKEKSDKQAEQWQKQFDETRRMNDVNIGLEKEKMQLAREEYKLKEKIANLDAETKKAYYDIMGDYYATKSQVESVKAAQKAMSKGESVVSIPLGGKKVLVPTSILIRLGGKYGVNFDGNVGDPAKAGLQVYQDIMTKLKSSKGMFNSTSQLEEFEAELEKEIYLYDPESLMPHKKYENLKETPAEGPSEVAEAEEAEEEEAEQPTEEVDEPKQMEWD
jgi:peptidoglycan hydrolase-like protein with peptidoglycan-binding domain